MLIRPHLFVTFCACACISAFGQLAPDVRSVENSVTSGVQKLKLDYPNVQVTLNPSTGLPASIKGLESAAKPELKGDNAVDSVNKLLENPGFKSVLGSSVDVTMKGTLEKVDSYQDPVLKGNTIVVFKQTIAGIPVYGSEVSFVWNPGVGVTEGDFKLAASTADVITSRSISKESAKTKAQAAYSELLASDTELKGSEIAMFGSSPGAAEPQLVMYDPTKSGEKTVPGLRPTWVVRVGGFVFFVDANRGGIIHRFRDVHDTLAPITVSVESKSVKRSPSVR